MAALQTSLGIWKNSYKKNPVFSRKSGHFHRKRKIFGRKWVYTEKCYEKIPCEWIGEADYFAGTQGAMKSMNLRGLRTWGQKGVNCFAAIHRAENFLEIIELAYRLE